MDNVFWFVFGLALGLALTMSTRKALLGQAEAQLAQVKDLLRMAQIEHSAARRQNLEGMKVFARFLDATSPSWRDDEKVKPLLARMEQVEDLDKGSPLDL